ncbi:MAG: low specificity L-threonine aldolase [Erysipelotrichaceae bacterium]
MYSFKNDYSEGACPQIMEALIHTNEKQSDGYGLDDYSEAARDIIRKAISREDVDVHFFVGGTQANQTIIASILRPYEAVIACDSGHINVHETGAIEASGHKVLVAPANNGKLLPEDVESIVKKHNDEHMVKPAMIYISNATEIGTVYTLKEMMALRSVCDQYDLYFFMDGARLGSALCASDSDLSLAQIAQIVDVFYIGGTKNGALFGEACVITNNKLKKDFRYHIKQRGGMLAKGRLLGIQFATLLKDDTFYELAKHANACAQKMQSGLKDMGVSFFVETTTNQIFPILKIETIRELVKKYQFQDWKKMDDTHYAMRFVTSWATPMSVVDEFLLDCKEILKK